MKATIFCKTPLAIMKMTVAAFILFLFTSERLNAQTAEELIASVRSRLDKVNDYEASGTMKTNVLFIKAPIANVKIYFKKPDHFRINNEKGISFIPKGSMNIQLGMIFVNPGGYNIIDVGKDSASGLRVIKLLPKDDNSEVVLSTLYIDPVKMVIKKATTTTRENGSYSLEMTYGKFLSYGLADKVVFTFSTKEYKLPKGITFDYDDGTVKNPVTDKEKEKEKKGKVEIIYSNYSINKGVADSVFN